MEAFMNYDRRLHQLLSPDSELRIWNWTSVRSCVRFMKARSIASKSRVHFRSDATLSSFTVSKICSGAIPTDLNKWGGRDRPHQVSRRLSWRTPGHLRILADQSTL